MPIPTDQNQYDRIVKKIKAKVDRWPSAYASGLVVKEYKEKMKEKGKAPYKNEAKEHKQTGLKRWFNEKWVDIKTGKECGKVHNKGYYPTCRPSIKVTNNTPVTANQLSKKEKEHMVAQKQKAKKKTVNYKETKGK